MILTKDLPIDDKYPKSCVYWIYNTVCHTDPLKSGYVGVCVKGHEHRFKRHKSDTKLGSEYLVHKAMRKYGDSIQCKVLVEADPELCLLMEAMMRPRSNQEGTWNLAAGGESPAIGYVPTLETRQKISAAKTGCKYSDIARANMSAAQLGRKLSDEARKNMSIFRKGIPLNLTPEQRLHRSKLMKERRIWDNPETRQKIITALTGRVVSDEERLKLSLVSKGVPKTKEHAENISKALIGKKKSDSHVKAMSDCQKKRHENIGGWENYQSNRDAWSKSLEIFDMLQETPEMTTGAIQRKLHLSKRSYVVTIHRDITERSWNPSEDSAYLSWLSEYNLKKEAENV